MNETSPSREAAAFRLALGAALLLLFLLLLLRASPSLARLGAWHRLGRCLRACILPQPGEDAWVHRACHVVWACVCPLTFLLTHTHVYATLSPVSGRGLDEYVDGVDGGGWAYTYPTLLYLSVLWIMQGFPYTAMGSSNRILFIFSLLCSLDPSVTTNNVPAWTSSVTERPPFTKLWSFSYVFRYSTVSMRIGGCSAGLHRNIGVCLAPSRFSHTP